MTPSQTRPPSLRERILAAETLGELEQLLALGASEQYRFTKPETRSRWRGAAARRKAELERNGRAA